MENSSYQQTYGPKIGSAGVNVKKAIAGSTVDCLLTYTVGKYGIDDSGSLKVLFRIVSDYEEFQFDDAQGKNYVSVFSSNKKISIRVDSKSNGIVGKTHVRPWTRGMTIHFSGGFLSKDDKVYVQFRKWQMQTFCEKTFEFRIMVDPFATAKYIALPHSPEIEIIPGAPSKLVIVAPTIVDAGRPFRALIKTEDQWGNPNIYHNGFFTIQKNNLFSSLPEKLWFKKGRSVLSARLKSSLGYIEARYNALCAISNPIQSRQRGEARQYWAELHAQSEETVGTGTVKDYYYFARDYAFMDVICHQANDFQVSNETWKKINTISDRLNSKNFVAFPGFEWSGNTANGGDHNVVYRKTGLQIYRSSHALVDEYSDISSDTATLRDLFKKLPKKDALVISHVGGRWADMSYPCGDDSLRRAIEIYSCWGTFEWLLHDAFDAKKRVGVVANSDGHTGRPGAGYPGVSHFTNYGGLTCILAKEFTRNSVFQALWNRHAYGTSGARIYLSVQCLLKNEVIGMMGDIISKKVGKVQLRVAVSGTSSIDRIEVWNKHSIIYSHIPEAAKSEKKCIKIAWQGAKVRGRASHLPWNHLVQFRNNSVDRSSVEAINFYARDQAVFFDEHGLKWRGKTSGNTQAVIFALNKDGGIMRVTSNSKKITLPIAEISRKPHTYRVEGYQASVEIYSVESNPLASKQIEFMYNLPKFQKGDNPVFIKIIQRDGHMAWSSPIYFV